MGNVVAFKYRALIYRRRLHYLYERRFG